ncbi:hypothetical protein BDZ94DRAFT_6118 [Collybia nuda]|uniref:F-box domain-containing protein n=1 Tax=Collybia nuda TaxID=64659 RepID=A0A9P5YGM2_9AGAR|nr:hypothetical protein BDZ94DRAFT_6118 [Collybia nuda]
MDRIPQEICSDIMDYIPDKRTLSVLLASSRHFAPEANRRLFRYFSSNNNPQHQTLFLTALLSPTQPYRGLIVHRLSLRLAYNDPASSSILTLLTLALPHLSNLTHLTLSSQYDTDFRTVLPFADPAPFQLHSLTLEWDQHGDPEPDPTQPAFLPRFLASQHALEELALPNNYYHLPGLPQTALQRVQRVWGPIDFVREIANGRPGITHARCEDGVWWTGLALPGGFLSQLTVLNLSTAVGRPFLRTIAAHLEVLEVLVLGDFHVSTKSDLGPPFFFLARIPADGPTDP